MHAPRKGVSPLLFAVAIKTSITFIKKEGKTCISAVKLPVFSAIAGKQNMQIKEQEQKGAQEMQTNLEPVAGYFAKRSKS